MRCDCLSDTDNDSDDTVNEGSPKARAIRQHRKEKKEFPVSHPNKTNASGHNVYQNQPSRPSVFAVSGCCVGECGLVVSVYISHLELLPRIAGSL